MAANPTFPSRDVLRRRLHFRPLDALVGVAIFLLLLIDGLSRTAARRLPFLPDWLRSVAGAIVTIGGHKLSSMCRACSAASITP